MQTLNVGAGQTDQEYQTAQGQPRADLLAESRYPVYLSYTEYCFCGGFILMVMSCTGWLMS